MKCGSIAIIGRPSSGKSTMVNTIVEMPVSITAKTPQTTRNAIRGIYTDQRGQLIFTDTPGYHLNEQKFNLRLQEIAVAPLNENDIVLYVVDASRAPGEEEFAIIEILKKVNSPILCVFNKTDIISEEKIEETKLIIKEHLPNATYLSASAKNDEGIDEILIELFKLSPEGEIGRAHV